MNLLLNEVIETELRMFRGREFKRVGESTVSYYGTVLCSCDGGVRRLALDWGVTFEEVCKVTGWARLLRAL